MSYNYLPTYELFSLNIFLISELHLWAWILPNIIMLPILVNLYKAMKAMAAIICILCAHFQVKMYNKLQEKFP